MNKIIIILLLIISNNVFAQSEIDYDSDSESFPKWIKLMYSENADPGIVIEEYTKFYKENKFLKNQHTQYYKRWIREIN